MAINILKDSKVFVPCPAGVVTGGAELLHQLVDVLNNNGRNSYLVYFGDAPHKIPTDYKKYNIKLADEYEDSAKNVIVIYEGYFELAFHFKQAQIVLWWLSVDNYFLCNKHTFKEIVYYRTHFPAQFSNRHFLRLCKDAILYPQNRLSLSRLKKLNPVCNAYQSEYAKYFLSYHGFENLHPLKDYINDDNFQVSGEEPYKKEDIVIYNPKKGLAFTRKLQAAAPEIKWVPIQHMVRQQVIELMRKSKVYVDFGYHPGKDRLPREAATNGCCIITGKLGSAGYDGDIHIQSKYKHNQTDEDVQKIIIQIRDLLHNYKERIHDFEEYRNIILKERKAQFNSSVFGAWLR